MAVKGQMPVQGDPEYGDLVAAESAAAAVPPEETPLVEPVVSQEAPVSETGNVGVSGNIPIPPAARSGASRFSGRPQNLLRLPPEVLNPQQMRTPVERAYSAGMLWDVLAQDPNASPIVRIIAKELKGQG